MSDAQKTTPLEILKGIKEEISKTNNLMERNSKPWWSQILFVFVHFFNLLLFPLKVFNLIVDTVISAFIVSFVVFCFLVYHGDISQDQIINGIRPMGKKIVDIFQNASQGQDKIK